MKSITTRSFARAGFLGNPSDGYFGKTVSFAFSNFGVELSLTESSRLRFVPGEVDDATFDSPEQLVRDLRLYGYYGGIRLLKAVTKRFWEYCQKEGKPLPKRNHIVLSDDTTFTVTPREGFACDVVHSKDEVLELAAEYEAKAAAAGEDPSEAVFICGGASIYELFFDDCDAFYVTRIDEVFDADRFFPNLEEKGFIVTWESEEQIDETTGIRYTFRKYERP